MISAAAVFESLDELLGSAGRSLGPTAWEIVPAARVDAYRRSTGDRSLPGYVPPLMLVGLTNLFMPQLIGVPAASSGVNYGTGRVRFGGPVEPGSQLRARGVLDSCDQVPGGVQTTIRLSLDVRGGPDEVCQVESLSRWFS